ncbi:hypothetical protein [Aeromonas rivipollensis]|uniref:hypothetical protein n=1 Tax=Aeromonas rivipollensis TaxID=948519 RepID=UPI003D2468E9
MLAAIAPSLLFGGISFYILSRKQSRENEKCGGANPMLAAIAPSLLFGGISFYILSRKQ